MKTERKVGNVMVEQLPTDARIKRIILDMGIDTLYPPQAEAIVPALEGKNVLMAVPTACGKSLVAYITVLDTALRGGKALYIVPLRALASEKYEDLLAFGKLGIKVGISVGDYDTPDSSLEKYDILVATSEKADSLLRHRSDWLHKIKIVIADEIHLINDPERGPTLEVTLAKFRQYNPDVQIIALSATVGNAAELADWLGARLISSSWRPVPLKEGVCFGNMIYYSAGGNGKELALSSNDEPVVALLKDCLASGGQVLVFSNTRRTAESTAEKCSKHISAAVSPEEKKKMEEAAQQILDSEEESTSFGAKLARCVSSGSAFHHAGLTSAQRRIVERAFRAGIVKCISATPTLAAGINMPARRVIIKETHRYEGELGFSRIPVLEIKQMCGRAGRPKYDKEGEAVFIATSEDDIENIFDSYIYAGPEDIMSKLGTEPSLRTHMLAAIATEFVKTRNGIFKFIDKTFYSYRKDITELEETVEKVVNFLVREKMIIPARNTTDSDETVYEASRFGRRISDLYIDPMSGVKLRDALIKAKPETGTIGYLHAICSTTNMLPLYIRKSDDWLENRLEECLDAMIFPPPSRIPDDVEYQFYLSEFKTACMIEDWIDEIPEDTITDRYHIGPGDIRARVESAEWLAHSMYELSALFNPGLSRKIKLLVKRISTGAKEELLDLISIPSVGRKRARALYSHGIKSVKDVIEADTVKLQAVEGIGSTLAMKIKAGAEELERKQKLHWE